jgi:hypothetical protein
VVSNFRFLSFAEVAEHVAPQALMSATGQQQTSARKRHPVRSGPEAAVSPQVGLRQLSSHHGACERNSLKAATGNSDVLLNGDAPPKAIENRHARNAHQVIRAAIVASALI